MSCFSNVTHQAVIGEQLSQTLSTEYACLKDLCGSDKVSELTSRTCVIHLDPMDEGHFAVCAPQLFKVNPLMLLVEIQFLEQTDHAE